MDISLNIDGEKYEISDQDLTTLVSCLEDTDHNQALFDQLAHYPEKAVRQAVSEKRCLGFEAAGRLFALEHVNGIADLMLSSYKELEEKYSSRKREDTSIVLNNFDIVTKSLKKSKFGVVF